MKWLHKGKAELGNKLLDIFYKVQHGKACRMYAFHNLTFFGKLIHIDEPQDQRSFYICNIKYCKREFHSFFSFCIYYHSETIILHALSSSIIFSFVLFHIYTVVELKLCNLHIDLNDKSKGISDRKEASFCMAFRNLQWDLYNFLSQLRLSS